MNTEIINQLHQIGLSVNEAKVYGALLGKKSYSATEIANIAGVPRQMVYRILAGLIDKGLCVLIPGPLKKFSASDPQIGLKHLVDEQEQKLRTSQELLETLQAYFKAGQNETNPLEYIKLIKEKKQVADIFQKLEREAKNEILVFSKSPYSLSLEDNKTEFETLSKGVVNRAIYERGDIIKGNNFQVIDTFVSAGEQAKVIKELPVKLAVFDEKVVLLILKDPITHRPSLTTLFIEQSDFAKVMKAAFEKYWDMAIPWDEFKKANSTAKKNDL